MSALPVIREEHGRRFFEVPEELWEGLVGYAEKEYAEASYEVDRPLVLNDVEAWKAEAWARRNRDLEGVLPMEVDADVEPQEEKCESGLPDCGDVAAYDAEGAPLCDRCARQLCANGSWAG